MTWSVALRRRATVERAGVEHIKYWWWLFLSARVAKLACGTKIGLQLASTLAF
jgi:hypothetical protein